jgi:cell wall-associated NlpC family hydrolase
MEVAVRKLLLVLGLTLAGGALPSAGAVLAASGTPPIARVSTHTTVSGAAIAELALRYVGDRYMRDGRTPSTGFDDMGFVSYVYRSEGIRLPRTLKRALHSAPRVARSDLQPGDIVYFRNTIVSGLSHAGIYLGGGKFIHAEWYNRGVVVSSFTDDSVDGTYWEVHYLTANRPWARSN